MMRYLFIFLILAGCMAPDQRSSVELNYRSAKKRFEPKEQIKLNQLYFHDDQNCDSLPLDSKLEFNFLQDEVQSTYKESKLVNLYMGGEYSWFGRRLGIGQKKIDTKLKVKEFRRFKLCDIYIKPNSYEYSATQALFAMNMVEENLPASIDLPVIDLIVAPEITFFNRDDMTSEVLANNAFYTHDMGIVVLQTTENFGYQMSDFPQIVAHEYSHHIFSHYMRNFLTNFSSSSHHFHDAVHSFGSAEISEIKSKTLYAYNEAIADLLAHYLIDSEFRNIGKQWSFSDTREVDVPMMANSEKKILSLEALRVFLTGADEIDNKIYKDSHVIGAIIAHGLYTLIESDKTHSTQTKIELIINSLKKMNTQYQSMISKSDEEFPIALLTQTVSNLKPLDQEQFCTILEEKLPILSSDLLCQNK